MAEKSGGSFFKKLFDKGPKEYPIDDKGLVKGWNNLGRLNFDTPGSTYIARTHELDFCLDQKGYPYLVFLDKELDVRKYNGKEWEHLEKGNKMILSYSKLTIDSNGAPYIFVPTRIGGSQQGTVLKYTDKKWTTIAQTNGGQVLSHNIKADQAGSIYLAYDDAAYSNRAVVSKFDGTTWKNIGIPGFP